MTDPLDVLCIAQTRDEFLKIRGKDVPPDAPAMLRTGRSCIRGNKPAPSRPGIIPQSSVQIVVVNIFESFEQVLHHESEIEPLFLVQLQRIFQATC